MSLMKQGVGESASGMQTAQETGQCVQRAHHRKPFFA